MANGGVARPLTFDLMAQMESEIFNACSEKPDLIICSTNVWRKYSMLFEPLHRFNDDKSVYDIFGKQQLLVVYYQLEQYSERLERELEQRQHEQQY